MTLTPATNRILFEEFKKWIDGEHDEESPAQPFHLPYILPFLALYMLRCGEEQQTLGGVLQHGVAANLKRFRERWGGIGCLKAQLGDLHQIKDELGQTDSLKEANKDRLAEIEEEIELAQQFLDYAEEQQEKRAAEKEKAE